MRRAATQMSAAAEQAELGEECSTHACLPGASLTRYLSAKLNATDVAGEGMLCALSESHAGLRACACVAFAVEGLTALLADLEQRVHACSDATKQLRIEAVTGGRAPVEGAKHQADGKEPKDDG